MDATAEKVIGLRDKQASEAAVGDSSEHKTKLIEELSNTQCIGTSGWLSWTCPY